MSIHALSHVMRHSEATLAARLVVFVLAEHAHDDGTNAFPKVDTIAARTRLSRRGVQAALRKLEESGEIVAAGKAKDGQTNWTVVGLGGGAESAPLTSPGGRSTCAPRGEAHSPEPSVNRHTPESVDSGAARGGGDQLAIATHPLADRFKLWFASVVAEARGGVRPRPAKSWDEAASRLLESHDKDELKAVLKYALTRPYWASRVKTLPLFAKNYPDVRAEWSAAETQRKVREDRERERGGRFAPDVQVPERSGQRRGIEYE